MEIKFKLNGKEVVINTDPSRRLLDVLREDFKITSVKEGCGEGECGACSVFLNNKLVNSCIIPVGMVEGEEVETIEGVKKRKIFKIIENSFQEESAVQCGFCTPGFVMASIKILEENIEKGYLNREIIKEGLSGNLCRCTGYEPIINGVEKAYKILKNEKE